MKLVIEVNKEDYKRYKEDKVCSYASAVLDAVPLNEVFEDIKAEIQETYHDRPDSYNHRQRTELYYKVLDIIDKHIGKESE